MTITTTFVTVLRRFKYLAEKVMYSNHYSKMTNISIDNIRKNVTTSLGINDYELDFNLVKHAVHGCMTNSQRII
jgi:chlorite dismutase